MFRHCPRVTKRGERLIGLKLGRIAQRNTTTNGRQGRLIALDTLAVDGQFRAGAKPIPPQVVELYRGLMPRILGPIFRCLNPKRACLTVETRPA